MHRDLSDCRGKPGIYERRDDVPHSLTREGAVAAFFQYHRWILSMPETSKTRIAASS
jgi:hypothetical protein